MFTNMLSRKLIIIGAFVFTLLLVWLIPRSNTYSLKNLPQELEYVNTNVITNPIYLLSKDDLLGKTSIVIENNSSKENIAKEILEVLINDGEGESKIPSGFKSYIPSDTKINSIKLENDLLKINFSKDILNIDEKYEEKMVEGIVYSLTSIEGINKIIIYVDNSILSRLPNSNKLLPGTLDKKYGINKMYDISTYKDISDVTIYYLNKYNDEYFYVPVTKYLNDDRDKIKIIIEELTSSNTYNTNLMSFLNSNTKLLASNLQNDKLTLEFNEYIFNDMDNLEILEEVIDTISLSILDNYDVKEVIFNVKNKEIYKSVLKTIE